MLNPKDIAIVSGARTPMGRYCGKLRDFTAQELGAVAACEAIARSGLDPKEFDHAVFGNAQQTSGDAIYGARHVALKAGLPIETPALTVNRLCGSGMQAIVNAAQMIQLGEAKTVLAGGMESMSQAPHVIRGMRWGVGLGEGKLEERWRHRAGASVGRDRGAAGDDAALRTAAPQEEVRLGDSVYRGRAGHCHDCGESAGLGFTTETRRH
jgi:acetyl-CoA acetyltransferase